MDGIDISQLEQLKQIEEVKKKILGSILTKEAFERLARVRSVNSELAGQAELYLIQIYQTGKLRELITDEQMKDILRALSEDKKIKIKRR